MKVTVFCCGPAVNESETVAIDRLKRELQNVGGGDEWILLTNLAFSVSHQFQSDEIDIIAIGPPGVWVIEVKHWSLSWVSANPEFVQAEADKVTNKARKIGTTLRRIAADLPHVEGSILLTQAPSKVKTLTERPVRGVRFYTLTQWKDAVGFNEPHVLSPIQVASLSRALVPKSAVAVDGSLRHLAGYINLELQTPRDDRFHRVYKGRHSARRDRVVLHLYDVSASDSANTMARAQREFESLHRLQFYPWAPRILDSWQDAPGYAGEMFFFTVVDPAAPSIEDRSTDATWDSASRVSFARDAVRALIELHQAGESEESLLHRNLNPLNILVRHDNSPIFTGFDRTRIPSDVSVASTSPPTTLYPQTLAPEVQAGGLAAADQRSDVYSLCFSLKSLFAQGAECRNVEAMEVLDSGTAEDPGHRAGLAEIDRELSELLGDSLPPPAAPPARFWTEDQMVPFRGGQYRIVTRLGSGGVGTAFKVVEMERSTGEELGTYVAKAAHDGETGQRVLRAYSLARSHLGRHEALSTIYEVARQWQENDFVSLLAWIDGTPLHEFTGVFPLLAEEQDEPSAEALAIRWLRLLCEAIDVLHSNGLVHGDISPRNMIVAGNSLVLTDYDFVSKIGEAVRSPGTVLYCAPPLEQEWQAAASNDLYALAASFFHVLFEREPFRYGTDLCKERGLNWEDIDRGQYPVLAAVLDKATNHAPQQRFSSAMDMLAALGPRNAPPDVAQSEDARDDASAGQVRAEGASRALQDQTALSEQRVDWLLPLLQSYPGSRRGNRETRGLDTEFATDTYVETPLEESLLKDIRSRRVRLVVLCGNAGDGKTALLQHLARQLGLGRHSSSERILEGRVSNGPRVRMNLDGSAAWKGRSADEILDKFLEPFLHGTPAGDIVHLLAINDGRLLEWIDGIEERLDVDETPLTAELRGLLQQETARRDSHIRFITLNQRSLVGGVSEARNSIDTGFLERLLDHLYGGSRARMIWTPCLSCSAKDRCSVFKALRVFGPTNAPALVEPDVRSRARQRLFEALQAVHLRGETHITVRELRAALVYILFGVHFCDDYHAGADEHLLPYWDRAFAPDAPYRQGEVLKELAKFDPALEAHPQIDRQLLSPNPVESKRTTPRYEGLSLQSARRRAFFEWLPDDIGQTAGDRDALGLARGRHLNVFRQLPLERDGVKIAQVCEQLCAGIARLEDLPPQALDRPAVVPLRITPRTPTETAFWVEKPMEAFRLEAVLPPESEGLERLHRQVHLIYRYRDGSKEYLRLGADLFHLLLELADGYQLGDVSTDDTFAHLSIFVQRLVREDERELLAWNPMQDEQVFRVAARIRQAEEGPRQRLEITRVDTGAES